MPALAAADLLAGRVFRKWGATVRSARRFGGAAHAASLVTFVLGLGLAIVVGLPLIGGRGSSSAVSASPLGVRGFVYRRISFGHLQVSDEEAIA